MADSYDPSKLVEDVRDLLRATDVETEPTDERRALAGAYMLLRSLGVSPTMNNADQLADAERLFNRTKFYVVDYES
jgi:hypothetical protein